MSGSASAVQLRHRLEKQDNVFATLRLTKEQHDAGEPHATDRP